MAQRLTRKQRSLKLTKQRAEAKAVEAHAHACRPLFGSGSGKSGISRPKLEVPDYASTERYPSIMTNSPLNTARPLQYEGEMADREAVAQLAIKEKRGRVAVVCHKSGYQYVGAAEDPKTFGKKAQALD